MWNAAPFPHQIDDQTAHDPGRVADESLAIRKHGILPGHVEVGFMQKGGWTDRRTGAAPQLPLGKLPQIAIQGSKPQSIGGIGPDRTLGQRG
jgi:hypothetical protein